MKLQPLVLALGLGLGAATAHALDAGIPEYQKRLVFLVTYPV